MSIQDESPKGKSRFVTFLDSQKAHNIMVFLVILGVSIAAFSLGVLSKQKDDAKVIIESNPSLIVATAADYAAGTAKRTAGPELTGQTNGKVLGDKNDESGEVTSLTTGAFVASKKGKKYYPVGCQAAKSLSATNRIYFEDAAEAEAKGYSLSTSC